MNKPNALKGIEYLKNHPEARAQDLKDAFYDTSIKGIICAIGGDDTYRTLPYLMEDDDFINKVQANPKFYLLKHVKKNLPQSCFQ